MYSGIFVAAAHGFLYSALAVAPIMLVAPLLQLSLVFRFLFALILNPHHEVFGFVVIVGTIVSIVGACAIAIDTDLILRAVAIPEPFASFCAGSCDLLRPHANFANPPRACVDRHRCAPSLRAVGGRKCLIERANCLPLSTTPV